MYARGLSTRDIEALFTDKNGASLLSRTAVSEITERLWAEYEAFATRDLSEFEITYLFVDGITERLHLGQPREAVLAAWGILSDGKKALLHLAPGTKEDGKHPAKAMIGDRQAAAGISRCFQCQGSSSCSREAG
jgi:putative transposase